MLSYQGVNNRDQATVAHPDSIAMYKGEGERGVNKGWGGGGRSENVRD